MKTQSVLVFVVAAVSASSPAFGMSKSILRCNSTNTYCTVNGMPLLNQMSETGFSNPAEPDGSHIATNWFANGPNSSDLCVPTSGSMMLQGVIANASFNHTPLPVSYPNSLKGFDADNEGARIGDMSSLMGTSTANGTYYNGYTNGTSGLAPYFTGGTGNSQGGNPLLTVGQVKSTMNGNGSTNGAVMGIALGWYKPQVADFGVLKVLTFSRNGGHANAFSGYMGDYAILNDPWGGYNVYTSLPQLGTHFEAHSTQTCWPIIGCFNYPYAESIIVPGILGTDALRDAYTMPNAADANSVNNSANFTFIDEYHTLGAE